MFKCCKKDDVVPPPFPLSGYREEGVVFRRSTALDQFSNIPRRALSDLTSTVPRNRSGLCDISDIQLPPLPTKSEICREEGGASSRRSDLGRHSGASSVLKSSENYTWDEGSASRRKFDVGSRSRRRSDVGNVSRRRSNVGKQAALPCQAPALGRVNCRQAYAEQCHMCAETALKHFNNTVAIVQWGVPFELVDAGISVPFLHMIQGVVYHSNFHAKPMNSPPETPTMLIFSELWMIHPNPAQVNNCCVLGQTGSVFLGLNGCKACGSNPDRPILHHPNGSFDVGEEQSLLWEDDGAPDEDLDYGDCKEEEEEEEDDD